ncbi:beta-phosphoglucomutase [Mesoflavibacter sabulilitoris]|uniref:Beta-phosphoglucomutase n=1 Tax=Mesoflavibacter zeaxanthinifaciens subsp. sabulilitoris TaxID=1520893 RepID=A0A2T1N7F5_9FLAO|nr:beta-phosphoglucomutase [Mesoflavibacter zeaxanthinifaciens]MBB3124014.1 beta-phosphoglucomutase [Mesoflavibacter zeaxanthinifaciens subsp. sabulilitoris]PSG87810.1 beta-phosphoglucomutase [Mesoflavibacter zeaxanthinifaciens subsp. sabulilitoris]
MNKKGFIFDLDGVIVDTAKYHFLAWQKLAKSIGIDFSHEQNEQLKGVSRVKSLEKILAWGNKTISEDKFNALMASKNDDYLSFIAKMNHEEILPDVPKVLNYLKTQNQPISLGSASKNARQILEKVDLLNQFDAIVDGNDVSKAKPDPEVFLIAAKLLNVNPKDCIVFEDSVAGVQAANTANMISIGIGEENVLHEADYVFSNFTEIDTAFIDKLIKR